MSSTAVAEGTGPRPDQTSDEAEPRLAIALGRAGGRARPVPRRDGDRDRPAGPPLLAGLDLHLDRRADGRHLDGRRRALAAAPGHGLAADHRRPARVRPAARRGRRQSASDPLAAAGGRGQDPRARSGPDSPPPGRALHAGPPAFLGLRGVQLLVLSLLRDAARGGRDLALPPRMVQPLRGLHRRPCGDGPGHLRALPGGPAVARGRPRLHRSHLPDHPRRGEQPAGAQGRRALPEGDRLGERRCRGALTSRRRTRC